MPVHSVNVKWGKMVFPNVQLNTDLEPMVFKATLFDMTGVLPERQKIMIKGAIVGDLTWDSVASKIQNNTMVLMMGSKEEDVPSEPCVMPTFIEDMDCAHLARAIDAPPGLTNLGNTCYLNATIQCLRTVPELLNSLERYTPSKDTDSTAEAVTTSLKDLFNMMETIDPMPPVYLLRNLHLANPRFAEKNSAGNALQQDANECWSEIMRMLQPQLAAVKRPGFSTRYEHFIDQYFGGVYEAEWKCEECDEEPVSKTDESFLQLSCYISPDVKFMSKGLKSKLQEKITKHSQCLNRDAVYTKTSKIKRLPAYLTVQFVRFYYKEKEGINAKILKEVKFPTKYDAYELCTPELQALLNPMRRKIEEAEEKQKQSASEKQKLKTPMNADDQKELTKNKIKEPFSFADDLGSNNSGYYKLQAVLTHRGRTSCSGHYVAWVKRTEERWMKCDDDEITPVHVNDVINLCGGGDWHCAYVLLYGPEILETDKTSEAVESS